MLVNNYISPVEFLVWTVLFTHILVVITGGGSKHKSSDRDRSQTTGKNQVNNINIDHLIWPESVACCYRKLRLITFSVIALLFYLHL